MFDWNENKNQQLIIERGISFDEIVEAINNEINPVKIEENDNYENQYKMYLMINDYIYIVPFEIRNSQYWLITAWKDRKANKPYKDGKL